MRSISIKSILTWQFTAILSLGVVSAQNVGIGTTSPDARLHIAAGITDSVISYHDFEDQTLGECITYGSVSWEITSNNSMEGDYSIVATGLNDGEMSILQLEVTVPPDREAEFSFGVMTDTEEGSDSLVFLDNGVLQWSISGQKDWRNVAHILASGHHILQWIYEKDNNNQSEGQDAAWIDIIDIRFVQNYSLRINDGTEGEGRLLMSDAYGNAQWQSVVADEVFDKDADTGIRVEQDSDDDKVRFFMKGTESWMMRMGVTHPTLESGTNSVHIGDETGLLSTAGHNCMVGFRAGANTTNGDKNVYIGSASGYTSDSGSGNSFVGYHSGYSNTSGYRNTYLGYESGWSNSTGYDNTFVGSRAGRANTVGIQNVFIGHDAAYENTTGDNNTIIGVDAGLDNTVGYQLTFVGKSAGGSNTDGHDNTFIGYQSGLENTEGHANVAVGRKAMPSGDHHDGCTYVGSYSSAGLTERYNSTAIGYFATNTASHQVTLGGSAVLAIGGYAPWTDFSDRRIKRDIAERVPGLEFINELRPVSYTVDYNYVADMIGEADEVDEQMNESELESQEVLQRTREDKSRVRQTGFIAQEVEQLVETMGVDFSGVHSPQNEGDLYGLRYAEFTVPLVKAVQELSEQVTILKEQVESQRNELEALKSK